MLVSGLVGNVCISSCFCASSEEPFVPERCRGSMCACSDSSLAKLAVTCTILPRAVMYSNLLPVELSCVLFAGSSP